MNTSVHLRSFQQLILKKQIINNKGCVGLLVNKRPVYSSSPNKDITTDPLPYSAIPSSKDLPLIGTFRLKNRKYYGRFQAMIQDRFAEFGPIYKENILGARFVFISDANAIEELVRTSDRSFPSRLDIVPWSQWRKENNEEIGLFTENHDGEKWRRMRSALDKPLMKPVDVATHTQNFSDVATDFVNRIRAIRSSKNSVNELDVELFNWAIEAIGTVLYEIRLGGLSEERDPEMKKFIKAIQKLFVATEYIMNIPQFLAKTVTRKWYKIHDESWKVGFQTTRRLVNQKREALVRQIEQGEEPSGFLAGVISKKQISEQELYANIMELFGAAVETTSNSIQFALYLLARNPEVQGKLYNEVSSVVSSNNLQYSHIQKLPYLRGFIKEVLRLYPPAMINRYLNEDMVLCGYHIPAETSVLAVSLSSGTDPRYFSEPDRVRPERWFRENKATENIHPFSSLPFGHGQRSCIGRRLAELEMYTLLIKVSQNFVIQNPSDEPLSLATRLLLVPEKPVEVTFVDRAS